MSTAKNKLAGASLEILLIVVGVLIDLGVNEIRDDIRDRRDGRQYLDRLLEDIQANPEIAASFTEWHGDIVEHATIIFPFVGTGVVPDSSHMNVVASSYHPPDTNHPDGINQLTVLSRIRGIIIYFSIHM